MYTTALQFGWPNHFQLLSSLIITNFRLGLSVSLEAVSSSFYVIPLNELCMLLRHPLNDWLKIPEGTAQVPYRILPDA